MNLTDANTLARQTMDDHGLATWGLSWDNAKARAGQCQYGPRVLSFSRPITRLNDAHHFQQTVLHEIAHALTPGHKHDRVWLAQARAIGYVGSRTCGADTVAPERPWTGVHDGCSQTFPRHRRPKATSYCPDCYKAPKRPTARDLFPVQPDNSAATIRWVPTSSLVTA